MEVAEKRDLSGLMFCGSERWRLAGARTVGGEKNATHGIKRRAVGIY
jgi:hypothetical protein